MRIIKAGSVWIGGGVLVLIIVAVWWLTAVKDLGSSPTALRTVPLERGDLVLTVPATGVVAAAFSVEIKSKASGEIMKIHAEEGDRVEKGEVLIEIDPRIEEIALRRARADLSAAEAGVKKAEILLKKARLTRTRNDQLQQEGLLSDQEWEEAHHLEGLQEADLAIARAQLLRARESLLEAEERLRQTRVISPLSGVLLSLYVERGQIISSGTSSFSQGTLLAVVGDLSRLRIEAEVDETDARLVVPGQEARITLDAFPGQSFRASVKRIAPGARIKNDLAVVGILLDLYDSQDGINVGELLRPGLTTNAEIVTQQRSGVLLLPREAVRREGKKWGVSLLQGERVSFQEVKVGATDGEKIEILTDLPEGSKIALEEPVRRERREMR